jgi:hypothetical protein
MLFLSGKHLVVHEVKTDSAVFQAMWRKEKSYEIRYDDRIYKTGDIIVSRETRYSGQEMKEENRPLRYVGNVLILRVVGTLKNMYGLQDGWIICSTEEIDRRSC